MAGLDFNTGSFSHSIRFGYLKAELDLRDATQGSGLPLANYPLEIQMGNTGMVTGPNSSAPLLALQSDHQFKYDGSKTLGAHIIRYGVDFNRIAAAGFVPFGTLAPSLYTNVGASEETFAQGGPFPGGDTNPLNYPVESVTVSNGLGYVTPFPGLGLAAGNVFYHRLAAYSGDSWKWKRNLTLSYGLRLCARRAAATASFPRFRSSTR